MRADGVDYSSIAAYKKAKGEGDTGGTGTGGTKPTPGGDGELGE